MMTRRRLATALAHPALAQPAANRTLRFLPQAPLTILDPQFTTANVTRAHAALVFDTLFSTDANLQPQPQPQMAEGHTEVAGFVETLFRFT